MIERRMLEEVKERVHRRKGRKREDTKEERHGGRNKDTKEGRKTQRKDGKIEKVKGRICQTKKNSKNVKF